LKLSRKDKKKLREFTKLFEVKPKDSWLSGFFYGRIATFGKMEIFIKSNERCGHHEPHIHVKYRDIEASFSILTGEMIVGKLASKNQKLIKAWILVNSEWLCQQWNELSNGIKIQVKSSSTYESDESE